MNWTHTSTAAVAAKKSGAPNTAKIRKTVINVIVHIFLAIKWHNSNSSGFSRFSG